MESKDSVWILLRGLGRESGHWGDFPNKLAEALNVKVHCIDLPGSGARKNEASPLTIQTQVDSLRNTLSVIRLSSSRGQKLFLLGISFGSMVATNWAQRFPKEISGLVIINPSFKGLSPWYCRIRPGAIPSILRAVFEPDLVKSETDVLSQVSNAPALYSKTSAQWAEIRKSRPVSRLNFFRQAVAASLAKVSSKKGMQVPSLILSSENDRLVNSPRCSKDAALALNAGLKFHPTAGHDLPLDDPEWIIVQLRGWLERLN